MTPGIRKTKNVQLKQLLSKEPTEGRIKEVKRLAKELQLGPGLWAKITVWMGPWVRAQRP